MFDFESITNYTHKYNFHSHTQFCDGRAPMEEFVREAISIGYKHYGFSPHSPILIESPCNMNSDDMDAYLAEVDRLKNIYGEKISLYKSLEIDYFDNWGPANEYFQALPLDYRIGSVHFIPSKNNPSEYIDVDGNFQNFAIKMHNHFGDDIRWVVEKFYEQELKLIDEGGFDIIGHFDKISNNASQYKTNIEAEGWYCDLVKEVFDAIVSKGYVVEINTKSYADFKRFFPHQRYFKWLKESGVRIVVNSDTHFTHLIDASREDAFILLNA